MKIQWGMMMTDGRGKLGGQVASKNRAGAYVRTKVTPSNPQTEAQSIVRSVLASLSKRWSVFLTEGDRSAWVEASGSGEWNKSDVFGNSRKPSGFNLFVGMNGIQQATDGDFLRVPPAKADFLVSRTFILAAQAGEPGTISGILEVEAGTPQTGTQLQIQATAPVSAGKRYVKNLYRDVAVQALISGDNNIVLNTEYEAKFGSLSGSDGKQIFVRVRQVVEGQSTPWVVASAVIQPENP